MKSTTCLRVAAIFGFIAVLLGAFGAHGLKDILQENNRLATWQTAVEYHFYHTFVLLFLGLFSNIPRSIFVSFVSGILIFSGSLYILCLTNIKWLGAITPIGGVAFMIGWGLVFIKATQIKTHHPQEKC